MPGHAAGQTFFSILTAGGLCLCWLLAAGGDIVAGTKAGKLKGLPVAHNQKTAPLEQGVNVRPSGEASGDTSAQPRFFVGLR